MSDRYEPPQRPRGADSHHVEPDLAALRARASGAVAATAAKPVAKPVDAGRIIARVSRPDGSEVRVSVHEYEGKPYVRVGQWQSSSPDAFPVKGKVTSLRRAELATVAAGLLDALDAMATQGRRDDAGR